MFSKQEEGGGLLGVLNRYYVCAAAQLSSFWTHHSSSILCKSREIPAINGKGGTTSPSNSLKSQLTYHHAGLPFSTLRSTSICASLKIEPRTWLKRHNDSVVIQVLTNWSDHLENHTPSPQRPPTSPGCETISFSWCDPCLKAFRARERAARETVWWKHASASYGSRPQTTPSPPPHAARPWPRRSGEV